MGLDQPKGPEIPKLDMYGKPLKPGHKYDITGKPIGENSSGQNGTVPRMEQELPQMDQMSADEEAKQINELSRKASKFVIRMVLLIFGVVVLLFVGLAWLIFSVMSGPSQAAEAYLKSLPDMAIESANFHYGSIDNDESDLVGNYKKDGKSYPVWVHLEKSGEEWIVTDFEGQPPQSVIDEMNHDDY